MDGRHGSIADINNNWNLVIILDMIQLKEWQEEYNRKLQKRIDEWNLEYLDELKRQHEELKKQVDEIKKSGIKLDIPKPKDNIHF